MSTKKLKPYSKKKYSKSLKNNKRNNNKRKTINNKTCKIVKKYKRKMIFNGGTNPSEIPPRHPDNIQSDITDAPQPPPPLLMRQNDFQSENNDDNNLIIDVPPPSNPPRFQRHFSVSSLPQPPDRPTILPIPHHTLLASSVDTPPLQFQRSRNVQNLMHDILNNNNNR